MLHQRVLIGAILSALLTTAVLARLLDLSPHENHVVQRRDQSEHSESQDEIVSDRGRRDISSELSHTHTSLTGDSHKFAAIHWSGLKESNVIFILTYDVTPGTASEVESSSLWRSPDYGASFENQRSRFDANATLSGFSYSDTDATAVALADRSHAALYLSRDEGASYSRVRTPVGFSWLDFFPGSRTALAAYDSAGLSLWGSVDGGSSWFKMSDGVSKYAFADKSSSSHAMYVITTDQLLYTISLDPDTSKQPQLTDPRLGTVSTSRLDKIGDYLFVEKETDIDRQLWVSHRRGEFRRAHFPTNTYTSQQVYHISSVHERQILVILTRSGNGVEGDLFLSEETGTFYSLSLKSVITLTGSSLSLSDVYVVSGMNGTLVANVVDGDKGVTMISYDSGAEWSRLPSSSSGCYLPSCSLNLLMSISAYFNRMQTAVFSKSSAVGVLLAHGTEGTRVPLRTDSAGIGLYVSRDGGQSWSRSQDGTWLVAFADFAGVIAAVPDFRSLQVTELSYSFDEGGTWYQYSFSQRQVTIGGLVTEPGEATLVDVLFAYDSNNKDSEWEIVSVNYSNILSNPCLQDDYENWTPYNARVGRDCLLGSTVTWQRKKPSSLCYNGADFNRVVQTQVCQCGIEDYECDWGYKHPTPTSQSCLLDPEQPYNSYAPSCSSGAGNFSFTRGFRKVAGDVCIGGEAALYEPIVKPCSQTPPSVEFAFSAEGLDNGFAELGRDVRFNLLVNNQTSFSQYYWDFGDNHKGNFTGLSVNHSFTEVGRKIVTVSTLDTKYSYNESIDVVNGIREVVLSHSYGVQVGAKTTFNAFLLTDSRRVVESVDDSPEYFGYVHFSVWYTRTGEKGRPSDELTQQFIFEHNFPYPGTFSMKVIISGPLNKVTKNFQIAVFEKVFVLELTFSQIFNISKPVSPEIWLTQLKLVLTDKLNELQIIPNRSDPEINIQPNSNIVYLSFNASNPSIDLNALLQTVQSSINQGLLAISSTYFHASVISARDVTDLIGLEINDNSTAYVGAIVFLVLIVLTLAFLLTLSITIILLMVKLCRQNNSQTTQGSGNRVYTHLRNDDAEMEPLVAESDDEHLLPATPDPQPGTEDQPTDPPAES